MCGFTEPVFKLGEERADPNSGKLGLADCVLEVENLALKLRMISKIRPNPTTTDPTRFGTACTVFQRVLADFYSAGCRFESWRDRQ